MNYAIVAASRFGMGAGPPAQQDPKSWLLAQLRNPETPGCLAALPTAASTLHTLEEVRKARREAGSRMVSVDGKTEDPVQTRWNGQAKALYLQSVALRYQAAIASTTPFCERLVAFWSNHFTVSGVRPEVRPMVGAYEQEAIRPHILGRFHDMVRAVVMHPAMGNYLDNAYSVGPDSPVGQHQHRGVNENLGRELLELHTLGVDGGYTESDVRALARILTGWTFQGLRDIEPGTFKFDPRMHEPGAQTLLGRTYEQDGQAQGEAALVDICRHPATARHVARQMAQHFIADRPPEDAVERLAGAFRESDGDLGHVTRTLVDLPESWDQHGSKVKDPWDLLVSASLVTGVTLTGDQAEGVLQRLGQPVYMAPQPSGWPDDASSWIGAESVLRRVEWCAAFAGRSDPKLDPVALGQATFGEAFDGAVSDAIGHAESRHEAVAMLLASPQFQRR